MENKFRLIFLFLFVYTIYYAQDEELGLRYSLGGFIELDHFSFFNEKKDFINSRNQGIAQIDLKSNYKNNYEFVSSIEFRNDLSDPNRDRVYLREIFINLYTQSLDLRVGKQFILWGRADGFNPTNNLTPVDYSDILDTDEEDIGIFALNSKLYLNDWEIQFVYSPSFQSSIFPGHKSRWQQKEPKFLMYGNQSYPVKVNWLPVELPQSNFKNSQYAVKISKTTTNIDYSLSYYYGLNDIPIIQNNIKLSNTDSINLNINQLYYKHHVVGGDFSWGIDKYILKGEGALFFPTEIPNYKNYFQYVLGAERTFNNIIEDKNLYIIIQWMQELKSKNIQYSSTDFNHLFQKNIMSRIEMDLNKNMKISLQGIYSLKYEDYYLKPEFKYNISDGLNLSMLLDLLGGNKSKNGFFSNYSNNNRIQIKLKYNF